MIKRFLLAAILSLPSVAFAERLGSLKSSAEVPLSTGTILNTSSVESKTLHVTSATVRNDFYFTDSDSAQRLSLSHSALPRSGGFGPQTVNTTLNVDTFEASTVSGGFSIIVSTELPSSSGFNRALDGHAAIDLAPPSAGSASSIGLNVRETGLSGASSSFTVQQSTISFAVGGTYSATWDSNGFRSFSGDILSDNHIVAYDVIGSTTGNFAFQSSTITFDAPPIDTLDRIPVLNNGTVSWPEMADGASLSSTQTFSGGNDFQGYTTFTGSVTAPASSTVDGAGKIGYDSTDGVYVGHNGTDDYVLGVATRCFTVTISTPPGGWVGTALPIETSHPNMAITLKRFRASIMDGTSITYNVEERAYGSLGSAGTDVLGADVAADTTGEESVVFSNASIAADAHLVLTVSAVSGSPNYFVLQGCYELDVE